VVIGSSTSAGDKLQDLNHGWVWRYRDFLAHAHPGSEVINLAVSGYSTYQLQPDDFATPPARPRVDRDRNISRALRFVPSAVIVNTPTNDTVSGFAVVEQVGNYERIIAEAARHGVPVWIATTQPRNLPASQRHVLIDVRDRILQEFPSHSLDFWTEIAAEDGTIDARYDSGDGTHLNDAAHAVLFARVRDAGIPAYVIAHREV
jgi:lysophospholipase L1-like esterase